MAEEKKNRSEELESLDKKINEIINGWNQNPEEIVEFLQFSSKFSYAYSPRNMMLIAQQQRGALLCKSFKAWKELGYSVKKGEHGMEVYVHTPITILKTDDGDIPYSKASKEQQAAYDVGEIEGEKLSYFKKGYTFDITQTNFPPEKYPKLLDRGIPSEFHRSCTNILKEYCEENLGLKVFLQDQEQNIKGVSLYGYHSPSEHEIHIASTLQDTAAFSTLTHEFGHALAHGSVEESLNTNLHQKEFEADVMSIMFCQHYGLEITDERKSHLSGHYKDWKKSDPNNFHPDKSMRKMFDLFREHSTVLDQKIVKAFPELATRLLPQRKKTQATTAKLKKVQTEIKKTKDKLNKLMAEEERLTVQYQTESYEETLAYLKSASKNGKPDLEEMWKFLQSTYSPELKNSVSPSTGNSAPSEESTDDVEENSETEETSSTVPEQKTSHYDSNDLEFLAD